MDKIRALRYFKRASELNSFSLAAKEFDVPASSISRRIKDLESELGVELLQRTTRNVSTTELGSVYYDMITEVLQKLNDADELISQHLNTMEGKIRISAMADYGERMLSPILQKFREEYPSIIFDLDYSDEEISFSNNTVDIAIRAGKAPEERVVAKQLSSSKLTLVATPKLLCDLQKRYDKLVLNAKDLETCPTLQYSGKHGHTSWWQFKGEVWNKIEINPVLRCNNGETLLAAVLAHEGLSLYPFWWVKDYLASGELLEVPVDSPVSIYQSPNFDVFILYQQAKYKVPKIQRCVDFIIQHLG
ncbi:LysR family transcriptional regulator [Photobacterium satsumensis]|uniref:LysR family transcriptional regulator n=1 Tax=Photobacterium satsumensis TaxID=2910239 RepID=UPI003D13FCD5